MPKIPGSEYMGTTEAETNALGMGAAKLMGWTCAIFVEAVPTGICCTAQMHWATLVAEVREVTAAALAMRLQQAC